jgi:hypothetical protein
MGCSKKRECYQLVMVTHDLEKFKKICSQISFSMPSSYQWQWDERFHVALIAFEKEDTGAILSTVSNEFDQQWDAATISNASGLIGELVNSSFGISPGQIIFTSEQGAGLILFAAWWPWDNGSTISLRIGIFSLKEHALDEDEKKEHLTEWFHP